LFFFFDDIGFFLPLALAIGLLLLVVSRLVSSADAVDVVMIGIQSPLILCVQFQQFYLPAVYQIFKSLQRLPGVESTLLALSLYAVLVV